MTKKLTTDEILEKAYTSVKENKELHPDRYGGDTPYECKKVLEEWLTVDEYRGWLKGTILKYLSRYGKKDDKLQEAVKIKNYADFLFEFESKQK